MGITNKTRGKSIFGEMDLISRPDVVIRRRATSITAAQIKALNTTPLSIVPAPGTGKVNVPINIFLKYVFLTTAFTGSNNLEFRYTSSNGAKVSADVDASFLLSASGTNYRVVNNVDTEQTPVVNAPIVIDVPSADPAQGLGSLTVQVFYRTLTV
jgi:hypothetical protein